MKNNSTFQAPGSKSQTQRALILSALAKGESQIIGPLDCEDSATMRKALIALGTEIQETDGLWRVRGGYLRPAKETIWCKEAGTVLRFLAPLSLLLGEKGLTLDGSEKLRSRPTAGLLQSLQDLGVKVRYLDHKGTLPLHLTCSSTPREKAKVD
ncbi:MAG: 3-phosphoshikimate 1-carboxyvinyltransferase, partial [Pseudomonadota bacterium]